MHLKISCTKWRPSCLGLNVSMSSAYQNKAQNWNPRRKSGNIVAAHDIQYDGSGHDRQGRLLYQIWNRPSMWTSLGGSTSLDREKDTDRDIWPRQYHSSRMYLRVKMLNLVPSFASWPNHNKYRCEQANIIKSINYRYVRISNCKSSV